MGSYLFGADIHDFLACLGKNAICGAPVTARKYGKVESEAQPHHISFFEDENPGYCDQVNPPGSKLGVYTDKRETLCSDSLAHGAWDVPSLPEEGVSGWETFNDTQEVIGNSSKVKKGNLDWNALDADSMGNDDILGKEWGSVTAYADRGDLNNAWASERINGSPSLPDGLVRKIEQCGVVCDSNQRCTGRFGPSGSNMLPLGKRRTFGNRLASACDNKMHVESDGVQTNEGLGDVQSMPDCHTGDDTSGLGMFNVDSVGNGNAHLKGWESVTDGVDCADGVDLDNGWTAEEVLAKASGADSLNKGEYNGKDLGMNKRCHGRFGPSGSNMLPLGKCRVFASTVVNSENDGLEKKQDQDDWQATAVFYVDGINQYENDRDVREEEKNRSEEGWNDDMQECSLHTDWDARDQDKNRTEGGWSELGGNISTEEPSSCFGGSWGGKGRVTGILGKRGFNTAGPPMKQNRPRYSRLKDVLLSNPALGEIHELQVSLNTILHHSEYNDGDRLKKEHESLILEQVLLYHPTKEIKLSDGGGVDYLVIDKHPEHDAHCFFVVRKDGTKADFSYWKCLEGLIQVRYSDIAKEIFEEPNT